MNRAKVQWRQRWLRAADYWWVLVVPAVVAAFFIGAYVVNPVEEAERHIGEPVASSLGFIAGRCPDGWRDTSENDEHALQKSCSRNGWIVVLDEKGRFQHGFQLDTVGAVMTFSPSEVPGWPAD